MSVKFTSQGNLVRKPGAVIYADTRRDPYSAYIAITSACGCTTVAVDLDADQLAALVKELEWGLGDHYDS